VEEIFPTFFIPFTSVFMCISFGSKRTRRKKRHKERKEKEKWQEKKNGKGERERKERETFWGSRHPSGRREIFPTFFIPFAIFWKLKNAKKKET
jgi:hypothetical protein